MQLSLGNIIKQLTARHQFHSMPTKVVVFLSQQDMADVILNSVNYYSRTELCEFHDTDKELKCFNILQKVCMLSKNRLQME